MSRASSLSMIGSIVMKLVNNTKMANEQKQYLLDALQQILSGVPADIAFGLKQKGRGKQSGDPELIQYRKWLVVCRINEILKEQEIETPTEAVFLAVSEIPVVSIHDPTRRAPLNVGDIKKIWYAAHP